MQNVTQANLDPMDIYSHPIRITKTKLAKLFDLKIRDTKPGRILEVVWDSRTPLIDEFQNRYSYVVNFKAIGNVAGNHYHSIKQELFYPLVGNFKVVLEDIKTKEREEFELNANQYQAVYLPTKIAHAIVALTNPATFLIIANFPSNEQDELFYKLL